MNKEKVLDTLEEAYYSNKLFMVFLVDLEKRSGRLMQISRESIRPLLNDLIDTDLDEVGLAKDEDYIWNTCCKSLDGLKFYRFIDEDGGVVVEILLTTEDNAKDTKTSDNIADQMLDLYTSSKTKGIYTLNLRYDDVYDDDTDYVATYPDHIYTDKEREEFFKEDLKDYIFSGEINCIYYSWTGLIKNWDKHKYYKFMHKDGLGHMEIAIAPLNAVIKEDEVEEVMSNLDPYDTISGDLWIRKTEKSV